MTEASLVLITNIVTFQNKAFRVLHIFVIPETLMKDYLNVNGRTGTTAESLK